MNELFLFSICLDVQRPYSAQQPKKSLNRTYFNKSSAFSLACTFCFLLGVLWTFHNYVTNTVDFLSCINLKTLKMCSHRQIASVWNKMEKSPRIQPKKKNNNNVNMHNFWVTLGFRAHLYIWFLTLASFVESGRFCSDFYPLLASITRMTLFAHHFAQYIEQ